MNVQGLGLFILAIAIIFILVGVYPFFGKKLLKIRWAWIAIGVTMFVYYFCLRVIPCWIELSKPIKMYDGKIQSEWSANHNAKIYTNDGIRLSNVLMLDLCPMLAFVMPLLAIFEKKRRILSYLAPIGFFAALLSILGGVFRNFDGGWSQTHGNPHRDNYVVHFDAKYIFIGNGPDHLFYMMHTFILILSVMVLLTTERKLWISILGSLACGAGMAIYAAIFAYALNIKVHAYGVVKGDWIVPTGEFSAVTKVVGSWQWAIPIGFIIAIAICIVNIIGFYFIRRIRIKIAIRANGNKKSKVDFKPFKDINNILLIKPHEIAQMWKTNWRLQ